MEDLIIWFTLISIGIFIYALITAPLEKDIQNFYENDDHDTIYAVSKNTITHIACIMQKQTHFLFK